MWDLQEDGVLMIGGTRVRASDRVTGELFVITDHAGGLRRMGVWRREPHVTLAPGEQLNVSPEIYSRIIRNRSLARHLPASNGAVFTIEKGGYRDERDHAGSAPSRPPADPR